jgi:SAM-dependent methyltransferase
VAALPEWASLRQFYERDYPAHYHHEEIAVPRATMFAALLNRLRSPGPGRVLLDVGCGGGHLLAAAAERGWSGIGTDLAHHACRVAWSAGVTALQADSAALPLRQGSTDAVSLINVLDHSPEPLETLREAYRVLRPDGRLLIRVPNAAFHRPWVKWLSSLGPLVRRRGWDGYPILHLFAFTPASLRRLVTRAGFRILTVQNSPLAAERIQPGNGWFDSVGLQAIRAGIGGTAKIVEFVSGRRWLVGPSIELYATRPPGASDAP